jgi:hypothetical protein
MARRAFKTTTRALLSASFCMTFWLGSAMAQEAITKQAGERAQSVGPSGGVVTSELGTPASDPCGSFGRKRSEVETPAAGSWRSVYCSEELRGRRATVRALLSIMDKGCAPQNAEYAAVLTKHAFLLRKLNRKAEAAALSAQARAASSVVSAGFADSELRSKSP